MYENYNDIVTFLDYPFHMQKTRQYMFLYMSVLDAYSKNPDEDVSIPIIKVLLSDYDTHRNIIENMTAEEVFSGHNKLIVRVIINAILTNILKYRNRRVLFALENEVRNLAPGVCISYEEMEHKSPEEIEVLLDRMDKIIDNRKVDIGEEKLVQSFYRYVFGEHGEKASGYINDIMEVRFLHQHFNQSIDAVDMFRIITGGEPTMSSFDILDSDEVKKVVRKRKKNLVRWMNEQIGREEYTEDNLYPRIIIDGFYRAQEYTDSFNPISLPPMYLDEYEDIHWKQYQGIFSLEKMYSMYPAQSACMTNVDEDEVFDRAFALTCLTSTYSLKDLLTGETHDFSDVNIFTLTKIQNYEEFLSNLLHMINYLHLVEGYAAILKGYVITIMEGALEGAQQLWEDEQSELEGILEAAFEEKVQLTEEITSLKKRLQAKELFQNKGNSSSEAKTDKQIRGLEDEIRILTNENRKLKAAVTQNEEDKEELYRLREYYYMKENSFEEKHPITEYEVREFENTTYSNCFVFVGGRYETLAILKKAFPNSKFLETETDSVEFDWTMVEKVFFFWQNMNHPLFYKVINVVRDKKVPFEYIRNKNIKIVYSRLKQLLKKNLE